MAGIQKTINRSGFDLNFWSVTDCKFNANTDKVEAVLSGYKDRDTWDASPALCFKGGEVTKVFRLSDYDGSNFILWIYGKCLEPRLNASQEDTNIFKDGVFVA